MEATDAQMVSKVKFAHGALGFWRTGYGLLIAAALLSTLPAWWLIAWPVASLSNVADHPSHFLLTYLHMTGGTGMLLLGAVNLYLAARRIAFPIHRRVGQAYLTFGAVGTLSALAVTVMPFHKPAGSQVLTNVSVSLASLSIAWIAAALLGWRAARNRRFDCHRDWMIRAYVLVWSFVFCRLGSRVPQLGDLGNGEAFSSCLGSPLCSSAKSRCNGGTAQRKCRDEARIRRSRSARTSRLECGTIIFRCGTVRLMSAKGELQTLLARC